MTGRGAIGRVAALIRAEHAAQASEAPTALFAPNNCIAVADLDADEIERQARALTAPALEKMIDLVPADTLRELDPIDTLLATYDGIALQAAAYAVLVEALRDARISGGKATVNAITVRFLDLFHEGVATIIASSRLPPAPNTAGLN